MNVTLKPFDFAQAVARAGLGIDGVPLARGGAAGWQWPGTAPLSGALHARLPRIGVWSLLAPPGWRLRGSLVADVDFSGTKADPHASGTLSADDLALRL